MIYMAEGEELGSNLLRVVRSSRGCSGGDGASRDWEGGPETAAQAGIQGPGGGPPAAWRPS